MVDTILSDQYNIRGTRDTFGIEGNKENQFEILPRSMPISLPRFLRQITRDRYRRYVAQSISPRLVGTSRELLLQIATE